MVLLPREAAVLKSSVLFGNLTEADVEQLSQCLKFRKISMEPGQMICRQGERTDAIGFVLSGCIMLFRSGYSGKETVLSSEGAGALFGAAAICASENCFCERQANIRCEQSGALLFFEYHRLMGCCSRACRFHQQFVLNLVRCVAGKNLHLSRKIDILSKDSLRAKIACLLCDIYRVQVSPPGERVTRKQCPVTVTVPYGRQEMADYVNADRSALCRELGRMKKDGLGSYRKNMFELTDMSSLLELAGE